MRRALNIALRTAHLGAMGFVLGGTAFGVAAGRLSLSLWLAVGTGVGLAAIESGFRPSWLHEGRGLMTLAKLVLLCTLPLFGGHRMPVLLAVVVLGSVGSHMPGRFRHYSVLYGRVLDRAPRAGSGRAGADAMAARR
jgi:hypothetical protein